jgi:hypothetical protein
MLTFTSLSVDVVKSVNGGSRELYVFKIEGKLCHCVGSVLPVDGLPPWYV